MPPSRGLSGVEPSKDLRQNSSDHWRWFKQGDFAQKWNSSKFIVKEGNGAIAPLLEMLNDPTADAETHWFTIRALGHFPEDPKVVAALAAQISDTSRYLNRTREQAAELSAFAIETLAAMGPWAIEVLSQLLQNPQQRLLAAKALNQVRSSGVIPALISVAKDDDAMVRYYAIDALGSFHCATVTSILLTALSDLSAAVRKAAVMALGRRPDLQAYHQLAQKIRPLLWDVDVAVSCQAALALGRLGAEEMIEDLQQVLLSDHTPMALRIDTVRALEWCCDRSDANHQSVHRAFAVLTQGLNYFSEAFDRSTSAHAQTLTSPEKIKIQIAIVRVLGELRHPLISQKTTTSLTAHLQHQTPVAVLQAIIMALAGLEQPQIFNDLLPLLTHPADVIPLHTIAALKQLDPDNSWQRASDYLSHLPDQPTTDVLSLW
ncbi:hypothetical protein N836_25210 [Leptolyngbya sp. Heron Island J]|uniref:HEAT repeat domain-containing protein n=1 Tax=Leptolyngbya sp. Heron Island J TaxID=1385935 RepID=UPI0003B9D18E|nr:HEAT repeat domain-containing protein [Leptolyngbya sp. Heron Island J]ESA32616.1 hypothetical protein N836_25210 [Leptolyngbya sp. Heron Island J]